MGFFIQGLPPAKQSELREMAREKWANMPMPWEEGFKAGGSEDANPYLNYLGSNSDQGVQNLKAPLKEELAKVEADIADREFTSRAFQDASTLPTSEPLSKEELRSLEREKIKVDLEIKQLETARNDIQEQLKKFEEEDFAKLPEKRQQELIRAQTQAQGTLGS